MVFKMDAFLIIPLTKLKFIIGLFMMLVTVVMIIMMTHVMFWRASIQMTIIIISYLLLHVKEFPIFPFFILTFYYHSSDL